MAVRALISLFALDHKCTWVAIQVNRAMDVFIEWHQFKRANLTVGACHGVVRRNFNTRATRHNGIAIFSVRASAVRYRCWIATQLNKLDQLIVRQHVAQHDGVAALGAIEGATGIFTCLVAAEFPNQPLVSRSHFCRVSDGSLGLKYNAEPMMLRRM